MFTLLWLCFIFCLQVAFSLFFQDHGIVSSTSNNHNGGSLTDQVHYPGNSSTTMGQTSIGTSRTPYVSSYNNLHKCDDSNSVVTL